MTPEHEQLLTEVTQYLEASGYKTFSSAYADICDQRTKKLLAEDYSVPATYIRTRSDRIAFSRSTGLCFEFDAKTNMTDQCDVFVEVLPVVAHYAIARWFGLKTFYAFRWPNIDREDIGFAIDDDLCDLVGAIFVFDRDCQSGVNAWVETMCPHVFKNAEIIKPGRGRGSGDPAMKIDGHRLENFLHWKDLFKATCGT